ncbi:hypothetical protein T484DRAFT_1937466 [Baffinella frigidus]|nr:hypothetical protein T484DRAFT_1937466 [Cryptophyta sp. CCMP2293]
MGAATFGDDPGSQLLRRVSEVHYVDAGLNCRGAYLTQHIIEMAAQSREQNAFGAPPKVFLHGTPRQWDAKARPWVVQEKDRMAKMLREEGVEVVERMYFEGEKPTLSMHFRCLDVFDPTEGTTPT